MGRIISGHKSQESPRSNMLKSSDSMNKWKIPHYYKRSSNSHHNNSDHQRSSTSTNSNNDSYITESSLSGIANIPNIQSSSTAGFINSPKRLVSESRSRNKSVSSVPSTNSLKRHSKKKNKNDMVFVNYTVQDKVDDKNSLQQGTPLQQPTDVLKDEMISPIISESSKQQEQTFPVSQKLYRKRMFKIFGSSKHQKSVPVLNHGTDEASVALERSLSSSNLYNPNCIGKKSYNAFLKYSKLNREGNYDTITNDNTVSFNQNPSNLNEIDIANMEYVPKSKNDPTLAQPPTTASKSNLILNSLNTMTQSINRKYSQSNNNNNSNSVIKRSISVNEGLKVGSYGLGQIIPQYIEQEGIDSKAVEENDASVAFSKLIYKKRTDTNTSSQSLISPPTTGINKTSTNNTNGITISKPRNQRTASVTSLSSTNSRYSPLRIQSPARPRSSTRGSSVHRLSRDISTIYSPNNALHDISPLLETDTVFLDSRLPNSDNSTNNASKRVSVLSSGSLTNVNKIGHRRKQESISDNYKFVSTFSNGTCSRSASTTSATTPNTTLNTSSFAPMTSSGLLLTPPYATPSLTQQANSLSVASTPSGIELYKLNNANNSSRQTTYINQFQQQGEISNDVCDALADFTESLPLIKGISKEQTKTNMNNIKHLVHSADDNKPKLEIKGSCNGTYSITNNNNNANIYNEKENGEAANILRLDGFPYFVESSVNSSSMESVMANTLPFATTTITNPIPQDSLINDHKTNTHLVSNGVSNNTFLKTDSNLNEILVEKHNNNKETIPETITIQNDKNNNNYHNINGTNIKDDKLLEQMYLGFNFENPSFFFQDNDKDENFTNTRDHKKTDAVNNKCKEQIFMQQQMDSEVKTFENFTMQTNPYTSVIKNSDNNMSTNISNNSTIDKDPNVMQFLNQNNKPINLMHTESNVQNCQLVENKLITNQFNDIKPMTNNGNVNDFNDIPMNYQDIDILTNYFFDNMQK